MESLVAWPPQANPEDYERKIRSGPLDAAPIDPRHTTCITGAGLFLLANPEDSIPAPALELLLPAHAAIPGAQVIASTGSPEALDPGRRTPWIRFARIDGETRLDLRSALSASAGWR